MNYDVRYGEEQPLPAQVRDIIRWALEEYKITHVANYKLGGLNIWVNNLESLNHMGMVRLEEDEMKEGERNTKSK